MSSGLHFEQGKQRSRCIPVFHSAKMQNSNDARQASIHEMQFRRGRRADCGLHLRIQPYCNRQGVQCSDHIVSGDIKRTPGSDESHLNDFLRRLQRNREPLRRGLESFFER